MSREGFWRQSIIFAEFDGPRSRSLAVQVPAYNPCGMGRLFTFDEAVRLLPRVREALRQAIDLRLEHQQAEQEISAAQQRITMLGGALVDSRGFIQVRARQEASMMQLRQTLDSIHELGCLVKDLDTGLVDFPTLHRGREVYLCWRLGEAEIGWWHGTEEGFAGRKPIDAEFLAELSTE